MIRSGTAFGRYLDNCDQPIMSYKLLCLENPLLDIQVNGSKELLEKYGLKDNDAVLAEDKHNGIYDEIIKNNQPKFLAGGSAQNTARGAQYMLSPNSTVFIGCVGEDQYAKQLQEANEREGLHTEYLVDKSAPTGRCGVIVTGHNRSMCTDLAAANNYKLEHLTSPKVWNIVEQAQFYYVGGFHLTVCPPAIMALGKEAAAKNKVFAMNISAPFLAQFFKEPMDQTTPYCDYVFGNESEAMAFSESHGFNTKDITAIAQKISQLPKVNEKRPRHVVITQGTDPTIVATYSSGTDVQVRTYPVHAVAGSDIVDTTGAGDSFAGGFMAALVLGKPVEQCVDYGHWLASWTVRVDGPA